MAKSTDGMQRIGQLVPASSVAVPVFRSEDCVGKEYALMSCEFAVSENGGEKVTLHCIDVLTKRECEISTFEKAIVAQVAAIPEGTAFPILIKIIKYGRYHALE